MSQGILQYRLSRMIKRLSVMYFRWQAWLIKIVGGTSLSVKWISDCQTWLFQNQLYEWTSINLYWIYCSNFCCCILWFPFSAQVIWQWNYSSKVIAHDYIKLRIQYQIRDLNAAVGLSDVEMSWNKTVNCHKYRSLQKTWPTKILSYRRTKRLRNEIRVCIIVWWNTDSSVTCHTSDTIILHTFYLAINILLPDQLLYLIQWDRKSGDHWTEL